MVCSLELRFGCLPVLNHHREEEDGSRRSSFWPACWSCPAQGLDDLSTKGSSEGFIARHWRQQAFRHVIDVPDRTLSGSVSRSWSFVDRV